VLSQLLAGDIQILSSLLVVHDILCSLTTLEPRWHTSVLLLTLMSSSGCLSLAGRWTTTAPYALAVCLIFVLEVRENRGVSRLKEGDEECRDNAVRVLRWAKSRREGG
jgi:hypothetical protein